MSPAITVSTPHHHHGDRPIVRLSRTVGVSPDKPLSPGRCSRRLHPYLPTAGVSGAESGAFPMAVAPACFSDEGQDPWSGRRVCFLPFPVPSEGCLLSPLLPAPFPPLRAAWRAWARSGTQPWIQEALPTVTVRGRWSPFTSYVSPGQGHGFLWRHAQGPRSAGSRPSSLSLAWLCDLHGLSLAESVQLLWLLCARYMVFHPFTLSLVVSLNLSASPVGSRDRSGFHCCLDCFGWFESSLTFPALWLDCFIHSRSMSLLTWLHFHVPLYFFSVSCLFGLLFLLYGFILHEVNICYSHILMEWFFNINFFLSGFPRTYSRCPALSESTSYFIFGAGGTQKHSSYRTLSPPPFAVLLFTHV